MHTSNTNQIEQTFLTPAELKARWKVSSMFLWRLRRNGRLPAHIIGSRGIRFALSDILRLEAESRT
jgi:hypothetical protein